MKTDVNPHCKEVGKKHLQNLREERFNGYLPTCIEKLLEAVDQKKYTFEDLGTTEVEALDLMIEHVGREQLHARYQFPFGYLKSQLECRKHKVLASMRVIAYPTPAPSFHVVVNEHEASVLRAA